MSDLLTVTFWPKLHQPRDGTRRELTWDQIAERVRSPRLTVTADDKPKLGTWAFATFRDDYRTAETFDLAHALQFDWDSDLTKRPGDPKRGNPDLSHADLARAFDGLRYLAHTTASHTPDAARWRVIVPLSRPVDAADYRRLAAVGAARCASAGAGGLDADLTWQEPSRWFHVPANGPHYEAHVSDSDAPLLDVDEWLREADRLDEATEAAEWSDPIPLSADYCAEPFPVDALPPDLGECVRQWAESQQVPADVPGVLLLGFLAGALAGKAMVEVKPGWTEHLVLWVCSVMRSGSRKSPVFSKLIAPLDNLEAGARADAMKQIEATKRQRAEIERAIKAAKGDESAIAALNERLDKLPHVTVPTWSASDATPESIAGILADNEGRLLLAAAEAVAFQHMAGLYSRDGRANLDIYLHGWCGEKVSIHRVSKPAIHIPRPLLSVALAVQPDVLSEAASRREFAGRGVLQRFLWSVPRDIVGYRNPDAPPLLDETRIAWTSTYAPLLRMAVPRTPDTLYLTNEAARLALDYSTEVEHELRPGGTFDRGESFREWGSKAPGTAVRIAAVLAYARAKGDLPTPRVDAESVASGIRLIRYFTAHTGHALAGAGLDPVDRLCRRLLSWLRREPTRRTFTSREAHVQLNTAGLDAKAVEAAILRLVEARYLRAVEQEPRQGGGRPPSPEWAVNPRWSRI